MTDLEQPDLSGRTAFVTGTTRGIGKALALAFAECGANVVSTGKTSETDDYGEERDLEGTIEQTAREVRERGADAISIQLNVRDEDEVHEAVERTVDEFGSVDILVNNAGAIQLANVEDMPANRFDLMMDVNVRAAYVCTRAVLPYMREQEWGHVVMNSPPATMAPAPGKAAYALSKYGMSHVAQSLAGETRGDGVAVNSVWPVTAIDTRATRHFGLGTESDWRTPDVYVDAVLELLGRDPDDCTGNQFYDEDLLREAGVSDFSEYAVVEGTDPAPMSAQMFDASFTRE